MTTMIAQALATDGAWTLVASSPIANVLLVGPPGGWELRVASSLPAPSAMGMPVASIEGGWTSSALAAGENVYARAFGGLSGRAVTISGMVN